MRYILALALFLLAAGSALAQTPGTMSLSGPSTTPGAPQITPQALDAAINAQLGTKQNTLGYTPLSQSQNGADIPDQNAFRSNLGVVPRYNLETPAYGARGDARQIHLGWTQNSGVPGGTGYYIAAGSKNLYVGLPIAAAWGQAPLSAGVCSIHAASNQISVPAVFTTQIPTAGLAALTGYIITFVGVGPGGTDWSARIVSFQNIGFEVVNIDGPAPSFTTAPACTIIISPPDPLFTNADVGKGIGVYGPGAQINNNWLNSTIAARATLSDGSLSPVGVQLADPATQESFGGEVVVGTDDSAALTAAAGALIADTSVPNKVMQVGKSHYAPNPSMLPFSVNYVGDGKIWGNEAWRLHGVVPPSAAPPPPPARVTLPNKALKTYISAQTAPAKWQTGIVDTGGSGCTPGTYSLGVTNSTTWTGTYTCGANGRANYITVTSATTDGAGAPVLAFPGGGITGATGHAQQPASEVLVGDSVSTPSPDGTTTIAEHLFTLLSERTMAQNFSAGLAANWQAGTSSFTTLYDRAIGGTIVAGLAGNPLSLTLVTTGSGYTNGGPYNCVTANPVTTCTYYVANGKVMQPILASPVAACTAPTMSFPVGGGGQPATGSGAAAIVNCMSLPPSWYDDLKDPWLNYVTRLAPQRVYLDFGINDGCGFSLPAFKIVTDAILAMPTAPEVVVMTNYPTSLASPIGITTHQASAAAVQCQTYAFETMKHYAMQKGFGVIDINTQADLLHNGQASIMAPPTWDSAANPNFYYGAFGAIPAQPGWTWPTQATAWFGFVSPVGNNWSSCGDAFYIRAKSLVQTTALGTDLLPGNTLRVFRDAGGNFAVQHDVTTVADGGPINLSDVPYTITRWTTTGATGIDFYIGADGYAMVRSTDPFSVLWSGHLATVGGPAELVFTPKTSCRYQALAASYTAGIRSGVPGGQGSQYMASLTDSDLSGVNALTSVLTTLGVPGPTIQALNVCQFILPNANPYLQATLARGGTMPVQVGANTYMLTGATETDSPAICNGTMTFSSNVTVADATAGNAVVNPIRSPQGGTSPHFGTMAGKVYRRALEATDFGAIN